MIGYCHFSNAMQDKDKYVSCIIGHDGKFKLFFLHGVTVNIILSLFKSMGFAHKPAT